MCFKARTHTRRLELLKIANIGHQPRTRTIHFTLAELLFFLPSYPNWKMVIMLFLTWCIVLGALWRGVRSMGKSSYFFALFPYLCILFLLFAGVFREGAAEGEKRAH